MTEFAYYSKPVNEIPSGDLKKLLMNSPVNRHYRIKHFESASYMYVYVDQNAMVSISYDIPFEEDIEFRRTYCLDRWYDD